MSHEIQDFAPVMDLSSFRKITGNDRDLMLELIDLFHSEYPLHLERTWEAVRDMDALKLQSAAHALKGAIATFFAEPAIRAVTALQETATLGDLSRSIEVFDILEFELEQLNIALMKINLSDEE
jgi:HPt (histidine-containing phosphotransfer) domain-containing protein